MEEGPTYNLLTSSGKGVDDMDALWNQFGNICRELGAATVCCAITQMGNRG